MGLAQPDPVFCPNMSTSCWSSSMVEMEQPVWSSRFSLRVLVSISNKVPSRQPIIREFWRTNEQTIPLPCNWIVVLSGWCRSTKSGNLLLNIFCFYLVGDIVMVGRTVFESMSEWSKQYTKILLSWLLTNSKELTATM